MLRDRELGEGLRLMRMALVNEQQAGMGRRSMNLFQRLEALEEDYRLMCDYMLRGYQDNDKEEVYGQLLLRGYRIWTDMKLCMAINKGQNAFAEAESNSLDYGCSTEDIREKLENYVQESALLNLMEPAEKTEKSHRLADDHERYISQLFNSIFISTQWSSGEGDFYGDLLLSPTIDVNDARILTSAVMLACMSFFDYTKWLMLIRVYQYSDDEEIRQRALVGWVLALHAEGADYHQSCHQVIEELTANETVAHELLELQKQMLFCMNAEKDNETIQRDIMPTLIKNSRFNITRNGIEENEESTLNDILHPDAEDKAMEEMEAGLRRMTDMQQAGADIYFSGFSHMKRFSFFYTLSHWFMPFSLNHPAIRQVTEKLGDSKVLNLLFTRGSFCDSDKYSFALAITGMMERLPVKMREMMEAGEGLNLPGEVQPDKSSSYLRRMYLQDLYRFFFLYTRKNDFNNPFGSLYEHPKLFFNSQFFHVDGLAKQRLPLARFLVNHHWNHLIDNILSIELCGENAEAYHLKGLGCMANKDYDNAYMYFNEVVKLDEDNIQALRCIARAAFMLHRYGEAAQHYEKLMLLEPTSAAHQINFTLSKLNNGQREEALQQIYRTDYEYPERSDVKRMLAWVLLNSERLTEAEKVYRELVDVEKCSTEDLLNLGYCCWFQGNVSEAVQYFHQCKLQGTNIREVFTEDESLIERYQKNYVDRLLMIDIVENDSYQ